MRSLQPLQWATAFVTLWTASTALASSTRPLALHPRALSHPESITTRIIPRAHRDGPTLHSRALEEEAAVPKHDESFLLSFESHGQPFTLSLRPATTLLHPAGVKVVETHTDERGVRTVKERVMQREEALVYEGVVVAEGEDMDRWMNEEVAGLKREQEQDNWARIVVLPVVGDAEEEGAVRFQGAFAAKGNLYTIHSTSRYLATREALDPDPPLVRKRGLFQQPEMVIVRERDVLSPHERVVAMRKRGLAVPDVPAPQAMACGHDHLPFNTDPMHPVYEASLAQQMALESTPWSATFFGMPVRKDPSSPFTLKDRSVHAGALGYPPHARLVKRQGDIQTGGNSSASSNFINSIGNTAGCPKSSMVVFIGVAADCTYTNGESCWWRGQVERRIDSLAALSLYRHLGRKQPDPHRLQLGQLAVSDELQHLPR